MYLSAAAATANKLVHIESYVILVISLTGLSCTVTRSLTRSIKNPHETAGAPRSTLKADMCKSTQIKLEIWGRAQREAARGVRKQALINF